MIDQMRHELMTDLLKQKESIVLEQLNELISRGILVVEETQPVLVRDAYPFTSSGEPSRVRLQQSVRLTFKGHEYVERLEKENADLRRRLEVIELAVKRVGEDR